ncbi:MAG: hypothetical protein Q9Q40_07905 [Acidobacteriota bacterium]|nr:hypothetical protein [Acidobacteriota bacterium]MDQ7087283.1 hypothetical protein [Acidobacteriota bacterium]
MVQSLRGVLLVLVALIPNLLWGGVSFLLAQSLADPRQEVRTGLPILPAPLQRGLSRGEVAFPFLPLERDATEGLRHGFVQTSSGRFGFKTTDLTLAARVPLVVGRVYDAGLEATIPGVPYGSEPRVFRDLGVNWILRPTSTLIPVQGGYLLLTDEGGVVPYVEDPGGSGAYLPNPDRPSAFGPLEPDGQGGLQVTMSSGLVRFYAMVPGGEQLLAGAGGGPLGQRPGLELSGWLPGEDPGHRRRLGEVLQADVG